MTQNERDPLDSLLDSMAENTEMEKKIDEFAKNKQRNIRIQRARQTSQQFQETYASGRKENAQPENQSGNNASINIPEADGGTTVRMTPPSEEAEIPMFVSAGSRQETEQEENKDASSAIGNTINAEGPGGGTMVFNNNKPAGPAAPVSGTVVVSNDEIKNLLEKDEPLLRREYIDEDEEDDDDISHLRPPRKSGNSYKIFAWISAGVLIVVLAFGGYSLVRSLFSNAQNQQETQTSGFSQLQSWVEKFGSLSEDEQKDITKYKTLYDKLNDEEKRKINEILMNITGKNFDELLAKAQEIEKPDSNNDDVSKAEQKGQLQDQMDTLKSEIRDLQNQLSTAQSAQQSAQSDYDSKNGILNEASAALTTAQSQVDSLKAEQTSIQSDQDSLTSQISELQTQLQSMEADDEEYTAVKAKLDAAQSSAQENESRLSSLKNDLNTANRDLSTKQSSYDAAKANADAAGSVLNDANNTVNSLQSEIDSKNSQLSSLQQQYNAIG